MFVCIGKVGEEKITGREEEKVNIKYNNGDSTKKTNNVRKEQISDGNNKKHDNNDKMNNKNNKMRNWECK